MKVASVGILEAETLCEVLDRQALTLGESPFIACDEETLSYAGLRERSLCLAEGLRQLGLRQGDRIAMLSENSLAVVESFFACSRLGLVEVPLNIYLRGEFLRFQLVDSGCVAAIVDLPGLEAIRALDPPVEFDHLIVIEDIETDRATVPYWELIEADPLSAAPELSAADMAAIIYTSGTTGMPKGCMIPHGMFTRASQLFEELGYIRPGDRVLSPAPMFHIGFLGAHLAGSLRSGAWLRSMRRFSASTFMRTAREVGATVIYALGPNGMLLLAQPPSTSDGDPGALRLALFPPMAPESQREFERRFGVPVVAESYGQTECMPITASGLEGSRQPGSAGPPISTVEVAIVDDDDRQLPPDQVGEIVVRPRLANMMFKGYWNNPVATLETERNLWHHTGDLGRQSADGTIWIIDRKKDSIRRRGENVSSLELEAAIGKFPAVREVAVHAVPSSMGEDEIKACIVARSQVEPEELFSFFKASLPYFAVPRYVELMDELPVTAVGRVRKQALRERGITEATWDFEALGLVVSRDERRASNRRATGD